jgi:dTDP-glucose 4,6-dehydratase
MSEALIVTGGAGFIGCNFVRHALARSPFRVVVADKLTYAGNLASLQDVAHDPRFSFVRADIADGPAMSALLEANKPAAVINFAAETHVDRSIDGPRAFVATNVTGTLELLEATRHHLERLSAPERLRFRFLQISTDEVYGSLGPEGAFRETTSYCPSSPYAASKAGADHLVNAYRTTYGLDTIITNSTNNFGPYQFPEKLIPLMTLNALAGEPLPVYGDGGNVRDWLYVEDHCAAVLLALLTGKPGERYNIGAASERTNLALVGALCDLLDEIVPARDNAALRARGAVHYRDLITFVPDRPGHDRRYAVDASKIRRELGWKPAFSFEEGLKKTLSFYVQSRAWCDTVAQGMAARERHGLPNQPDRRDPR